MTLGEEVSLKASSSGWMLVTEVHDPLVSQHELSARKVRALPPFQSRRGARANRAIIAQTICHFAGNATVTELYSAATPAQSVEDAATRQPRTLSFSAQKMFTCPSPISRTSSVNSGMQTYSCQRGERFQPLLIKNLKTDAGIYLVRPEQLARRPTPRRCASSEMTPRRSVRARSGRSRPRGAPSGAPGSAAGYARHRTAPRGSRRLRCP